MSTAIQSVLAITIVVSFGFFAGKKNILSPDLSKPLSTLVMFFTFPAVLFTSMTDSSVASLLNLKFLIVFLLALMVPYFIILFFQIHILKRNKQISAMVAFVCTFPGMAFMGIPYLSEVLGSNSLISVAIGNVITSVFMIPVTVICLEIKNGKDSVFLKELFKLIRTPLIVAPILGIIFAVFHISVPYFVMSGLKVLGSATLPIALFTLGLMIIKSKLTFTKDAVINILLKLFLQPGLAFFLVAVFAVYGIFAKEIIILTAMPTAIIASMFAEKYDIYKDETVSTIIGSSVLSIVTLVLFTAAGTIF